MTTMTKKQVQDWLLDYAWMGTKESQAAEVECILHQDGWKYIDVVADAFAGAQESGGGPAEYAEGTGFALSALYECHQGPHLPTCPAVLGYPVDPEEPGTDDEPDLGIDLGSGSANWPKPEDHFDTQQSEDAYQQLLKEVE